MSADVLAYLHAKGLTPRRASGDEIHIPCIFCNEDDRRRGRLYVNINPDADILGLYCCHLCGEHGSLVSIKRFFGDVTEAQEKEDTGYLRRAILAEAATYYHQVLDDHLAALRWLVNERGLQPETIDAHQLGYADGGLFKHLRAGGHRIEDIAATGLTRVERESGRTIDFLNNHITIPYLVAGNVVMIRGRAFGEVDNGRKYVTPAGQKTRLFNTDLTWGADEVVVTEGEFDCYSGDTEILTAEGWIRFDQYDGVSPVVQWEEGGVLSVASPLAFVSKHVERTLALGSARNGGVDLIVTPGHRMVSVRRSSGTIEIHRADEPRSAKYHIPRVGLLSGSGLGFSDEELRLLVAISADASIDRRKRDGAQYVRFGFRKERKILRLRWLLKELDIPFSDEQLASGATSICFRVPNYLEVFKVYPWEWLMAASATQRAVLLQELIQWDGHETPNRDSVEYFTAIEANAIWVQALAHTSGMVATIYKRRNVWGQWYRVHLLRSKSSTSWQSITTTDAGPREMFCVQVPSGKLLVRRVGQVAVSGNCMVLEQVGYKAVACPGANVWQDAWDGYFAETRRVWIVFDRDEAATGEKGALRILDRLGPKARHVELPPHDHGKSKNDITEYMVVCDHTKADFDALLRASRGFLITVEDAIEEYQSLSQSEGLRFGIVTFDAIIAPGLMPSQVMVILAKTGIGKTLLLLNMFQRMTTIYPEMKILFVSLEQTRADWWDRARRIYRFYNTGTTDEEAFLYWRERLWLDDRNRLTEEQLRAVIDDFVYETGTKPHLVAVDYLGYWARGFKGESYQRTGDAVMALKAIAKDLRVPIIAPHQVSRTITLGAAPNLDSARDSGVVEETADFVLSLWRIDQEHNKVGNEQTGETGLRLLKSRHGGVGHEETLWFAPLSLSLVPALEKQSAQWARNEWVWYGKGDYSWEHALVRHETGAPIDETDFEKVEYLHFKQRQGRLGHVS